MLQVVPGELLHEEIVRIAQVMGVIVIVNFRYGNVRVLAHQAHGGHFSRHDVALILHHFRTLMWGDLENHLSAIRQPELVGHVEPALFELQHGIIAGGKPHTVESPGNHTFDLFPGFSILGFTFHPGYQA